MLFDLITAAKVSIKIEYPNKILLFIENLCFCSLKISGASKNYRLKITIRSKNYGLKIPVRVRALVCVRVRMIVRTPQDTRPRPAHTNGTQDTSGKERNTGKPAYIGIFADNEKKYKKS